MSGALKGKVAVKLELVARKTPEEAESLEDLIAWMSNSRTIEKDELFSFRKQDGSISALMWRTVRKELKRTCESNGLLPKYFSSHSLRKGAITHMRSQGASQDDRRDRISSHE